MRYRTIVAILIQCFRFCLCFFCKHYVVVFFRLIIVPTFFTFHVRPKRFAWNNRLLFFFRSFTFSQKSISEKVNIFFAPICREFRKFRRKKPQQNEQHKFMMDHRSYTHRLSQSPRFSQSPRSLGPFATSFARYHLHEVDLEQVYYTHNISIWEI